MAEKLIGVQACLQTQNTFLPIVNTHGPRGVERWGNTGWRRGAETIGESCSSFLNATARTESPSSKDAQVPRMVSKAHRHGFLGLSMGGASKSEGAGPNSAGVGAGHLCFQSTRFYAGTEKVSVKPPGMHLLWGGGGDPYSKGSLLDTPSRSSRDVVFGLG